jgi:glucoamylase
VAFLARQGMPTAAQQRGGYHLVWPCDAVEVGFALTLLGHLDDAAQLLNYLATRQSPDGNLGAELRGGRRPWL